MFTLFTNNKRNTLSVLIYKQKETTVQEVTVTLYCRPTAVLHT